MSFTAMYWLLAIALVGGFVTWSALLLGLRRQRKNLFLWHVLADFFSLAAISLLLSILETIATKLHLW